MAESSAERFPRHTMIRPSTRAWAAVLAQRPDLAAEPLLAGWVERGYPLVVRRPSCNDDAGVIPAGLPLPPSHGKRRVAVTLDPADILRADPPPLLSDAAGVAPAAWRPSIERLVRIDPATRIFGSLAWQHLTGLPYLYGSSDLDLLWRISPGSDAETLLDAIAAVDRDAPMRIDGEICTAIGAVQWRELHEAGPDILVKQRHAVRMMARAELLAAGMR